MAIRITRIMVASALALSLLLTFAGAPAMAAGSAHGVTPHGVTCGGSASTPC